MKQILFFILLIASTTATAQEIYATPFSYQSGSNTPGHQLIAGFMWRTNTGAAFTASAKQSTILREGVRSNTFSIPAGMGLNLGDVVLSLHVGPIWYRGQVGVIGGGQFMHLLPINSRFSSVISVDLNTSSFYQSEFVVCMGFAYKISKGEL